MDYTTINLSNDGSRLSSESTTYDDRRLSVFALRDGRLSAGFFTRCINKELSQENAASWQESRKAHCMAWQLPSTLVMTTSFSLVFALPMDTEDVDTSWMSSCVLQMYLICMVGSALFALKSVNDFLQEYLCLTALDASSLEAFIKHRRQWRKANVSYVANAASALNLPMQCQALWMAVLLLIAGICMGIGLHYGPLQAVLPLGMGLFFWVENVNTAQRSFFEPMGDFIQCKPKAVGNE